MPSSVGMFFFFGPLVYFLVCPSLYSPSVLLIRCFSFLLLIVLSLVWSLVGPCDRSFVRFFRLIDRSLVRSFVCPPVRLCLRSIVRTIIRSLVRPFACPFDRTCVCSSVLYLLRSFNFSFVPRVVRYISLLLFLRSSSRLCLSLIVCPPFSSFLPTFERKRDRRRHRHSMSTCSTGTVRILAVLWILK